MLYEVPDDKWALHHNCVDPLDHRMRGLDRCADTHLELQLKAVRCLMALSIWRHDARIAHEEVQRPVLLAKAPE